MYSKVKQCAVVVSEIAKSHGHNGVSSKVRKQAALAAAVLIAMGSLSFEGMPVAQADESPFNNDYVAANDSYWYYDEKTGEWKTYSYKATDLLNNRSRDKLPNYKGGGAKLPGAITAGLYAQAGQQTITIGDRNAGQSKGSVFIGELSGYNNGDNAPSESSLKNNYVTAVGFQSDATGWGSIAIGSNATAENTKKTDITVEEIGDKGTSGTVADDVYGIKSNPSIEGASVALGYSAHSKDGNIAIGSYSDATTTTDKTKTAYTDKDVETSYVSVGSTKKQRRITNVADGADASDVATVGQLQQAITDTGVNNKANIDASNIGANLKKTDGTTAADSTDITTNENAWGAAIGTGTVTENNGQLVTGGTVYNALQQQANDLKVNAGWGINKADEKDENGNVTKKNVISLNRNLGTNLDTTGQVKLTAGDTGLVLGTVVKKDILTDGNDMSLDFQNFGATGDYAVTVGGDGLMATGKYSAALGGYLNKASGDRSTVSGGYKNTASGQESSVSGGFRNTASGIQSSVSGGYWNEAKGRYSSVSGGYQNTASGENSSILGGMSNKTTTSGYHAVVVGGENNTANEKNSSVFGGNQNTANGQDASVVGGLDNVASGTSSVVAGGDNNDAIGNQSAVFGGRDNTAAGIASTAGGGIMNAAIGQEASVLGGSYNYALGTGSTSVGGLGREYDTDNGTVSYDSTVNGNYSVSIAGGSTGADATGALAAGRQAVVTTANGTAIGYQATTDEANTIAFGHDAGDVSGYTINWKQLPNGQTNADGTTNDYTQAPESVTETTYTTAGYNRLVKVADGQNAHDTVVMEQLTPYTKSDASNIGANLKTYTIGDDGETITEAAASDDDKNSNENAWGGSSWQW